MRQREIIWQGWRVSWPDVDGGRHNVTDSDRGMVELEAEELREAGAADVRVRPVTRYRLAPLVEIAAWRYYRRWARCGAITFTGKGQWGMVESHGRGRWLWAVSAHGARIEGYAKTKRAAIAAAEAALAVLGYRVAKSKAGA